jgi:hypothetical protein
MLHLVRAMSTPYRSDAEALQARLALLEEQLSALRLRRAELNTLQRTEARLESEIEDLRQHLDGLAGRRSLRLLEDVRVASPCHVSWDAMKGNGRARFCTQCQKNVYNLSGMTREEAESFVAERTSDVCIRLHRRHDGTVLTSDCPVGRKKKVRRWRAVAAFAGLVVTALAARGLLNSDRLASTLRRLGVAPPKIDAPQGEVMGMMLAAPRPLPKETPPKRAVEEKGMYATRYGFDLVESIGSGIPVGHVPAHQIVLVKRVVRQWAFVRYVSDEGRVVDGWTLTNALQ